MATLLQLGSAAWFLERPNTQVVGRLVKLQLQGTCAVGPLGPCYLVNSVTLNLGDLIPEIVIPEVYEHIGGYYQQKGCVFWEPLATVVTTELVGYDVPSFQYRRRKGVVRKQWGLQNEEEEEYRRKLLLRARKGD